MIIKPEFAFLFVNNLYDFCQSLSNIEVMNPKSPTYKSIFDSEEGPFREIFQSSNEGILVVDKKGVIQMSNPVGEKMFGYEYGELKGESIDLLVPDQLREHHKVYRQIYNADPQPRSMGMGRDLRGRRKDGSEFPIEVSLSNVELNDVFFVVAFIIDITRRKKAEEALKKSEEQLITYATELEQRVQKRTEALNRSVNKLEETNNLLQKEIDERIKAENEAKIALAKERDLNELKSRFVSMASHEFRTPLSSILSSVNLIQRYIENDKPESTKKHIERIRGSVKNLTDILNDFLSLGRLEEGKINIDLEMIDLREFIYSYAEEMEGILKSGQYYDIKISDQISVETDIRILKNVLANLISNASKYSPENSKVEIEAKRSNGELKLSIRDFGMGIPNDEQKHLFERFFRAKNAVNIQGTGLGLNIVKKYVELLGGEISFESELGKGTVFSLHFPVNHKK